MVLSRSLAEAVFTLSLACAVVLLAGGLFVLLEVLAGALETVAVFAALVALVERVLSPLELQAATNSESDRAQSDATERTSDVRIIFNLPSIDNVI
jgi:hypothetical protein